MELSDLNFDEILKPPTRWEASGDTFPHRENFISWGWVWRSEKKVWTFDGDEDEIPLRWAQRLKGVTVRKSNRNV